MKNIEMKTEKSKLTITIDLSKDFGLSSTGKTHIVASTEGNQKIDGVNGDTVFVGVNAYKKK